jgi:predicted kinase
MSGNLPFAPRVHLLAGLNGAGKTTFARQLEADLPAVRFTLDEWPRQTARMGINGDRARLRAGAALHTGAAGHGDRSG